MTNAKIAAAMQQARHQMLAVTENALVPSSGAPWSSCASTGLPGEASIRHPMDDITESTPCKLVVPVLGVPTTVARGLAEQWVEGTLFNGSTIPQGYAWVHVDTVI